MLKLDSEQVTQGYIAAMIWADFDTPDNAPEDNATEVDPTTLLAIEKLVAAFLDANASLVDAYVNKDLYNSEQFGHDLYLTIVGHGVGFWDRELDGLGDDLTLACHHRLDLHHYASDGYIHHSSI